MDEELLKLLRQQTDSSNVDNQTGAYQKRWAHVLQPQQPPPLNRHSFDWAIDADGEQNGKELSLKFERTGSKVFLTATYRPNCKDNDKANESKKIGSFEVKNPDLFYVWHEITSNGAEPYQLFFSLTSSERAFLDDYNTLPDNIKAALAKQIKQNENNGLLREEVVVDPISNEISISPNYFRSYSDKIITPLNLVKPEAHDTLAITPVKTPPYIIYRFLFNGKELEESFIVKHQQRDTPLLSKGHYSEEDETGKVNPEVEKAAAAQDFKFGSFTIPIQAGVGNSSTNHKYKLLFAPTKQYRKAKMFVEVDGKSFGGSWTIPMPYVRQRAIAHTEVAYPDHLDIYFHDPKLLPDTNAKADLTLRFQKMATGEYQYSLGEEDMTFDRHRVEALHIYTRYGKHKTYPLYYYMDRLQTRPPRRDNDDAFYKGAVKHARKELTTPSHAQSLTATKESLALQEEVMVQHIWLSQMSKFKIAEFSDYVDTDKDPKAYYQQYLNTIVLLRMITPLLNSIKQTKALPTDAFDLFQLKIAAQKITVFNTWLSQAQTALILPEIRHKVLHNIPKLDIQLGKSLPEVLESTDVTALGAINIDQIIESYRTSMLNLGKAWLKRSLKANENYVVKDAQKKGIDEIGNRRKNFLEFAKENKLKEETKITRVPAYFYPKTDWYDKERERLSKPAQAYLDTHKTPAIEVPLYVYKEGKTWHVVSNFSKTMHTHFHDSITLKTDSDIETYKTFPPLRLFEELNHADHLPEGWLIYNMPDGSQASPVKITSHWKAEEIAMWVGLALLAAGVIAFTGGWGTGLVVGGLKFSASSAAFTIATAVGGIGAGLMMYRKGANGMLTTEEKVFAWLDIASAILTGPLFLAGSTLQKAKGLGNFVNKYTIGQFFHRHGKFFSALLKMGDLTVDTTVMLLLLPKALDQIGDVVGGPGTLAEKTVALAKLLPLLAVQYGLFLGTIKGRREDIAADIGAYAKKMGNEIAAKGMIDKGANVDLKIDKSKAPEIDILKKTGWDIETLNAVYSRAGEKRFLAQMEAFRQVGAQELSLLKKLYPEEDLLYALYTHGNLKKARQALDTHYGYKNSDAALERLRMGKNADYATDVAPHKAHYEQRVKNQEAAQKRYDEQTTKVEELEGLEKEVATELSQADLNLSGANTRVELKKTMIEAEKRRLNQATKDSEALTKKLQLEGKTDLEIKQELDRWQKTIESNDIFLKKHEPVLEKKQKKLDEHKEAFLAYEKRVAGRRQRWLDEAEKALKGMPPNRRKNRRLKHAEKRINKRANKMWNDFKYDGKKLRQFNRYYRSLKQEVDELTQQVVPKKEENKTLREASKKRRALLAINQDKKSYQASLTQRQQDLELLAQDLKQAQKAQTDAQKALKDAQEQLKAAQQLKGENYATLQQAKQEVVAAQVNYQLRSRAFVQIKGKATHVGLHAQANQRRLAGIQQRYHWQYQMTVLLLRQMKALSTTLAKQGNPRSSSTQLGELAKKAHGKLLKKLRYGKEEYLDAWKGAWSIAKTWVGLLPGQVSDYPLEIQVNLQAYQRELDALSKEIKKGLLLHFGERLVPQVQAASSHAEALSLIEGYLKKVTPLLEDSTATAQLFTLTKQLMAVEQDIAAAEKQLKK